MLDNSGRAQPFATPVNATIPGTPLLPRRLRYIDDFDSILGPSIAMQFASDGQGNTMLVGVYSDPDFVCPHPPILMEVVGSDAFLFLLGYWSVRNERQRNLMEQSYHCQLGVGRTRQRYGPSPYARHRWTVSRLLSFTSSVLESCSV